MSLNYDQNLLIPKCAQQIGELYFITENDIYLAFAWKDDWRKRQKREQTKLLVFHLKKKANN